MWRQSSFRAWLRIREQFTKLKTSRKGRRGLLYGLLSLPLLVFLGVYACENSANPQTAEKLEIWLQFVTGNWPSSGGILDHASGAFALGVMFRFTLIYGSVAAVLRTLAALLTWRRMMAMNYAEMIRDRDDSIENELRGLMPKDLPDQLRESIEKNIHRAFEEGARLWEQQYLPAIVGNAELAAKIIQRLHREQVTP